MRAEVSPEWIDGKVMIPELLRAAPQVRPVLDRYGLRGCGGRLGPVESLAFFARAHDVPLEQLLGELREAVGKPEEPSGPADVGARWEDAIYRPFFKAGILVVLTLGATWGAYLLLRIGLAGSFTAAGLHEVNAHGHAQIFGWVGLFVMGFAYQAFPRFKHTQLAWPRLAYASLVLMLVGLAARSILQPLAALHPPLTAAAVAASAVEVAACALFVWVVLATWRGAGSPWTVSDSYVLCALAWFVLQAVYESVYLAATLRATGQGLIELVATWQAPLRDVQIHGFALLMILGVSHRMFHSMYGLPAPGPRRGALALVCLNAAVVGEVAGLLLMRLQGHAWAGLWYASVLLLAAAAGWLVGGWHIFSPATSTDRSLKFLRAAYVWLFVSLGMLALLPVYQHGLLPWLAPDSGALQVGFSHAYYGAVRHAVTVGFISLMIVGVAAKVVPTLNGVDVRVLPALWVPFLLVNAGCALRVVGQTLTDFTPSSFPFAGVSGLLEVSGLAVWGVHLWRIMAGRAAESGEEPRERLVTGAPITARTRVGDVLELYPELLETFVGFGFRTLASRVARRTIAPRVSLDTACGLLGVDVGELIAALEAARHKQPRKQALPVVEACCDACGGASRTTQPR